MSDEFIKNLLRLYRLPKPIQSEVNPNPFLPLPDLPVPLAQNYRPLSQLLPLPKRPQPSAPKQSLVNSRFRVRAAIRKAVQGDITLGRFLPNPDALGLADGRQLRTAILYADLRGFSSMIAKSPKRASLVVLESFVAEMSRIASGFHGEVVDCAGDRILVAFSRPIQDKSSRPIQDALTCAIWMQTVMAKVLIPELKARGYSGLSCGIGIDYGPVVIARVGIRNRNKLVFLGTPAVVAAKLEDLAGPGEILVSPMVYDYRPEYLTEANNWFFTRVPPSDLVKYYRIKRIFVDQTPPSHY